MHTEYLQGKQIHGYGSTDPIKINPCFIYPKLSIPSQAVVMFSVRHQSITTTTRKIPPSFFTSNRTTTSQIRNSFSKRDLSSNIKPNTISSSPISIPKPRKFQGGWSTGRALLLAAATGGLAYAITVTGEKNRRIRDYSDPDKFEVPKYADIREMEMVSLLFVEFVEFLGWGWGCE